MDDRFDQRLRERLSALDAAIPPEKPAIRLRVGRQLPPLRRTSAPILGLVAVVLVVVALLSAGLVAQRFAATESSGSPTAAASMTGTASAQTIVMGPGGFPVSIGGEKVYQFGEGLPDTSASFLVAAWAPYGAGTCAASPQSPTPGPTADSDLIGRCPTVVLGFLSDQSSGWKVAPKGLSLSAIGMWGGHIVVFRAHTHDPEAVQCSPSLRSRCEAALVVEAVVWPTVPTELHGEHVYRGADLYDGTLATIGGSFLFGGPATTQDSPVPGICHASSVVGRLVPYCVPKVLIIDQVGVASSSADLLALDGEVVVVRAHINDPAAAQCPSAWRQACETALVVESVVWSERFYPAATPTPRVLSPVMPPLSPAVTPPLSPVVTPPA